MGSGLSHIGYCNCSDSRSLPQQGHAVRRDPALDAGNYLQRQQPLLPPPHARGGSGGGGEL